MEFYLKQRDGQGLLQEFLLADCLTVLVFAVPIQGRFSQSPGCGFVERDVVHGEHFQMGKSKSLGLLSGGEQG